MDIQDIKTFLTIIETRSLSKAAEAMFVAQSTISHRLKSLEEEIGITLVVRRRGHRYIEITKKGEEFISIAERYLSLNEDIDQLQVSTLKSNLLVACVETLNSVIFPELYQKVITENPDILLNIRSHWSYVIYDLLESHEISIGLVLMQLHSRNIICEPLFKERMVMIYNTNYSAYPKLVNTADLDKTKEVYLNWSPSYQSWHDHHFSFKMDYLIKVDSSALILSFIRNTDSWIVVPISLANAFKEQYPIEISEFDDPPPERICYKIKHKFPKPNQEEVISNFENLLTRFIASQDFLSKIK